MWSELNLICLQMKLFEQLSGMTMSEDGIRREIVCGVHEVSLWRRGLSSTAYSGLCVADDTVIDIDQSRLKQRRKGEDDRGGVASGVGDKTGLLNRVAM
jgi:hypothetical protein